MTGCFRITTFRQTVGIINQFLWFPDSLSSGFKRISNVWERCSMKIDAAGRIFNSRDYNKWINFDNFPAEYFHIKIKCITMQRIQCNTCASTPSRCLHIRNKTNVQMITFREKCSLASVPHKGLNSHSIILYIKSILRP